MNKIDVLVCQKCIQKCQEFGCLAFSFYKTVCEAYLSDNILHVGGPIPIEGQETLYILEKHGYILTLDIEDDHLLVKPQGYSQQECPVEGIVHCIDCICKNRHEKNPDR